MRAWSQSRSGKWGFGTTFLGMFPVNGATLGQVYAAQTAQSTGHTVEQQNSKSQKALVSQRSCQKSCGAEIRLRGLRVSALGHGTEQFLGNWKVGSGSGTMFSNMVQTPLPRLKLDDDLSGPKSLQAAEFEK